MFGNINKLSAEDDEEEIELANGVAIPQKLLTFKVVIFDTSTQNIIAPIMNVGNLRDCNVVLHQKLSVQRDKIPDIPAVYLIEPTSANVKKLALDAQKELYDFFLVNFTKPASDAVVEELAKEFMRVNQAHRVLNVS